MKRIIHFVKTCRLYFNFFLSHLKDKNFVFGINIVDYCNLNCVSCDHFSLIIKNSYYYRNDLKNLSQIKGLFPKRIRILRGEPLLHPEIKIIWLLCISLGGDSKPYGWRKSFLPRRSVTMVSKTSGRN